MTFKELIEGIESGTHQIRIQVEFQLKWYVFQFVPDYLTPESNWKISKKGEKLIEDYLDPETGTSGAFYWNNFWGDKSVKYKKADEYELEQLDKEGYWEEEWEDELVGRSIPVYSTDYFSRKGVAVLTKDIAKFLIGEFLKGDENRVEHYDHSWNLYSEVSKEFLFDFPSLYWDDFISDFYPSDFFKEDIGEENIEEILDLEEDCINNKLTKGVNLDIYEPSFCLAIYKLKDV